MIERVSKRAFSGSSGTYHVRASELAVIRDRRLKVFNLTVIFLDGSSNVFTVEKRAKGSALLNQVYQYLELYEKDYFGLQYYPNGVTETSNCDNIKRAKGSALLNQVYQYLELYEKDYFGLQYYPNGVTETSNCDNIRWLDPTKSIKKQLNGRTQLYFRVKFYVSDPSKLIEEFTRYQFYLQIRTDIACKKLLLPPSTACLLASYMAQSEIGDYHPDEHGPNYLSELKLIPDQTEDMEKKICELHKLHKGQSPADAEFNFLDHAKRLDMYGVELHRAQDSANKDIQLGVTAIGLVVFQNNIRINTFSWSKIVKISFKRKQFFIQLRREPSESYDTILGFNMHSNRSAKTLWKACVEHHTFFRLHSPHLRVRKFPLSLGSRFRYSGRTESQTVEQGKLRARTPSRPFIRSPNKISNIVIPPTTQIEEIKTTKTSSSRSPWCDNKVTSLGSREPRKAWEDSGQMSDDEGGFVDQACVNADENAFSLPASRILGYADEEIPANGLYDTPPYSLSSSPIPTDGLLCVRLTPDEQGRFGFNVRGGSEHDMPILISRVAPNTPADRCIPKLREGDQLLFINGHDVTNASHSAVVSLIRAARDGKGELVLTIRPLPSPETMKSGLEEPPYCYVPESPQGVVGDTQLDMLEQSMLLLADGLASGALINHYEQLYRRHPELTCNEARRPENIDKNRYRDVSPYDATRVVLRNGVSGDYINANYVDMQITGTDIINHYIATQGPLSSTVDDFWEMVLETDCSLIIMLTTLVERGRVKCHQYWPNVGNVLTFRHMKITCNVETFDVTNSFVFREILLHDSNTNTSRTITHMQYLAWPDHGVPDDIERFLQFTHRVREARSQDSKAPVVVHCSAGIGRTGVLILMDTAMCLVEANQPVYPLDIVQTMRDQRAMMIQNASQYRFVCECICAAYSRGEIKPKKAESS